MFESTNPLTKGQLCVDDSEHSFNDYIAQRMDQAPGNKLWVQVAYIQLPGDKVMQAHQSSSPLYVAKNSGLQASPPSTLNRYLNGKNTILLHVVTPDRSVDPSGAEYPVPEECPRALLFRCCFTSRPRIKPYEVRWQPQSLATNLTVGACYQRAFCTPLLRPQHVVSGCTPDGERKAESGSILRGSTISGWWAFLIEKRTPASRVSSLFLSFDGIDGTESWQTGNLYGVGFSNINCSISMYYSLSHRRSGVVRLRCSLLLGSDLARVLSRQMTFPV